MTRYRLDYWRTGRRRPYKRVPLEAASAAGAIREAALLLGAQRRPFWAQGCLAAWRLGQEEEAVVMEQPGPVSGPN